MFLVETVQIPFKPNPMVMIHSGDQINVIKQHSTSINIHHPITAYFTKHHPITIQHSSNRIVYKNQPISFNGFSNLSVSLLTLINHVKLTCTLRVSPFNIHIAFNSNQTTINIHQTISKQSHKQQ